ncbi:hypothetical protein CU098_008632 [Rhizopus stolonifer]|uniref:Uncharacterized protein n=1 Tax=Rhizopus stolonifer TaxID=4846 RepID=A0A367KGJ8_RHIST|nr:hypothetical protein CU098_008632 [Rhizopus stolonifer]
MEGDICARVNKLSSIEYQKQLVQELKSVKDRERYIKVIEMSKVIQSKIECLQEEKPSRPSFKKNPTCHTYRMIDRATSLQFQTDSAYNSRRPSVDTVLVDLIKEKSQVVYTIKQRPLQRKSITISLEDDSSDEEVLPTSTIHVAVRKNASLFKLEKDNNTKNTTIQQNIITPPDSPQADTSLNLPPIIHVHKRPRSSLKGLLKRTFQLNQYTVTKTNSIPFSASGLLLKTINPSTKQPKLLLKLVIVFLDSRSPEEQRRFGFTFWWQKVPLQQNQQDDAKFALAPDSLVKEALDTWINTQNRELIHHVPDLKKADELLRDGRKIYLVYDTHLFSV